MADAKLRAERLTLGYGGAPIVDGVDVDVPAGKFTVVIGANASGKSTLLRGMARLLPPVSGSVLLDGRSIHTLRAAVVARELAILPQTPVAPDGVTVADLVARGRYPHQGWFRRWNSGDEAAVARALDATATADLAAMRVQDLSGGQRQRVWIAMVLAQDTGVLLLDEPTTFLDINHQIEVLDLVVDLVRTMGTTVVAVLHDLNLACRYADHLVVLKAGRVVTAGAPAEVVDAPLITDVFGVACSVVDDPVSATPMVIPHGRHHGSFDSDSQPEDVEGMGKGASRVE